MYMNPDRVLSCLGCDVVSERSRGQDSLLRLSRPFKRNVAQWCHIHLVAQEPVIHGDHVWTYVNFDFCHVHSKLKHEHRPRVTVQYTCARPRDHHRIDHVDTWTPSHVGIKGHKKGISPNRHGRTADVLNLKGERGFVFFATEEIGASRSFVVRWRC